MWIRHMDFGMRSTYNVDQERGFGSEIELTMWIENVDCLNNVDSRMWIDEMDGLTM